MPHGLSTAFYKFHLSVFPSSIAFNFVEECPGMNTRWLPRVAEWSAERTVAVMVCVYTVPLEVLCAETPAKRLRSAAESFREVMKVPEKGIPRDPLEKAECAVIVPGLKKGVFLVGGKYRRGLLFSDSKLL
jgi:hypothetical protein